VTRANSDEGLHQLVGLWEKRPNTASELRVGIEQSLWWYTCADAVRCAPEWLGDYAVDPAPDNDVPRWFEDEIDTDDSVPEWLEEDADKSVPQWIENNTDAARAASARTTLRFRPAEAMRCLARVGWALAAPPQTLADDQRQRHFESAAAFWRTSSLLPQAALTTAVLPRPTEGHLPPALEHAATLIAAGSGDLAAAFVALQALLLLDDQRVTRTVTTPVVFRIQDTDGPFSAVLTLSRVKGGPSGLFPDPRTMLLAYAEDTFATSLTNAWAYMNRTSESRECVLWSLTHARRPELLLTGESLGAPLAVALEHVLAQGAQGWLRHLLLSPRRGYAITGTVDTAGHLGKISGLAAKLAAAQAENWHLIAPKANASDITEATPAGIDVHLVETVAEARGVLEAFRRTRIVATALVIALTVGGTVTADRFANDNHRAAADARTRVNQELMADAKNLRDSDPRLSLLLGAAALDRGAAGAHGDLVTALVNTHYQGAAGMAGAVDITDAPSGHLMAAASERGGVTLWDTAHRPYTQLSKIPVKLTNEDAFAVSFSPDAQTLAVLGGDGRLVLWNVTNPRLPRPRPPLALAGKPLAVTAATFSPDGKHLAVSESSRSLSIWDVTKPDAPSLVGRTDYAGAPGFIDQLSYSEDGRTLAGLYVDDQDLPVDWLWNVKDPRHPQESAGLGANGADVVASTRGHVVAEATGPGRVTLWNAADPAHPKQLSVLTEHSLAVAAMAFSPDGTTLATAGDDRTVILYDVSDPQNPRREDTLKGHEEPITSLSFTPDGQTLATASDHETLLWSTHRPSALLPLPVLRDSKDSALIAAPDRTSLLTWSVTGTLWHLASDGRADSGTPLPSDKQIQSAYYSPDAKTLAVSTTDSEVEIYDLRGSRPVLASTLNRASATDSDAAAFSDDSRLLAVSDAQHRVHVWDLSNRQSPAPVAVLSGQRSDVSMLEFVPDGLILTAVGTDGTVTRWNISNSALIAGPKAIAQRLATPIHNSDGTESLYSRINGIFPLTQDRFFTQQDGIDQVWNWSHDNVLSQLASTQSSAAIVGNPDAPFQGLSPDSQNTGMIGDISHNGRLALTPTGNQIHLWDISDISIPIELGSYTASTQEATPSWGGAQINTATLSGDGKMMDILTQSEILLFDLKPLARIVNSPDAVVCSLAGGGLTRAEQARYLHGATYHSPCS
jgi:WD40 repeat protein